MDRRVALSPKAQRIVETLKTGVGHHQRGEFAAAEALYKKVRAADPRNFVVLQLSGALAAQVGNFDLALNFLSRALSLKPDYVDALNNRGNVYNELGRLDEALADYDAVLALTSDNAHAFNNRGTILEKLRRFDEALADYDRALALMPGFAYALNNRGNVLRELDRPDEALAAFSKATELQPDYAEAFNNRGNALKDLDRLDEALEAYTRAITLRPDFTSAYNNRGNVHEKRARIDEALRDYDKALSTKGDSASAFYNRGRVLEQFHDFDGAVAQYDKAISLDRNYVLPHWNKSLVLLRQGNFTSGWKLYEWRWKRDKERAFSEPLWLGRQDLRGKTILLHAEQGLGDTIQFCRYAARVQALGPRVVLEVQRPLQNLLRQVEGVDDLVAHGATLPRFDFHCPLMSLPLALGTTLNTIPGPGPYLSSDKADIRTWAQRLGPKSGPRIGIVWSGNRAHTNDHNRSIPLERLLAAIPENYQIFSLQKEVRDSDMDSLQERARITHFGEDLADFTDTAAVCDAMDIVLSVDTSVAHLAGALGKQTYVILPYLCDFRWLLDRDDSPWYAGMRLFRQGAERDWTPVLASVRDRLGAGPS